MLERTVILVFSPAFPEIWIAVMKSISSRREASGPAKIIVESKMENNSELMKINSQIELIYNFQIKVIISQNAITLQQMDS